MRQKRITVLFLMLLAVCILASAAFAEEGDKGTAAGPHTHDWQLSAEKSKPATCESPGVDAYVCPQCSETMMVAVPAKGHSWGGWNVTKAATCAEAGTETRTCTACGAEESRPYTDAGAHVWGEWSTTKEATCAAEGIKTRTCTLCGKQDTTVVDLGTLTPVNKMMKRVGWPITFTVDGNETVTLRLTVSGTMNRVDHFATGILLDDIKLVTATDLELFKDGDCEDATSGSALKSIASSAFGCENGLVRFRTDSESPADFGSEMVDGHVMVAIGNRSYLYEDVTLPFSGRYRLSFYTKSRLRNKTGSYGENPLDVFVNIGDATNKLGRIDTHNSGWTQRVFDFNVPSGGVYRVAFQGVNDVATTSTGSYMEKEAHIDSISLKQVHETRDLTPPFDPKAGIVVAEGARLETDFAGTNTIRGLRLGDVRCAGFVRAADYPEYLSGTGTFKIVPRGATVSFR